jgi:hypothetical protein
MPKEKFNIKRNIIGAVFHSIGKFHKIPANEASPVFGVVNCYGTLVKYRAKGHKFHQ